AEARRVAAERKVYPNDIAVQTVVERAGMDVLKSISPVTDSMSPSKINNEITQATAGITKQLINTPKKTLAIIFLASLISLRSIVSPMKNIQRAIIHFIEASKKTLAEGKNTPRNIVMSKATM
ncbi:MAG: hypothetical protein QXL67_02785, partial [Candidatus Bathyarchaeia archaeon]